MHQDESIQIYTKMFRQLGKNWAPFMEALKEAADKDDQSQLFFTDFEKIIKKFKIQISKNELNSILLSFPGKEGDQGKRIDITRLFDQKYAVILQSMYRKIDVGDKVLDEEPGDTYGYLGKTHY